MSTAAVLELCRRWQDATTEGDARALADLYAEDAVVESPLAGTIRGRDAAAQAQNAILAAFPDMTFAFEPAIAGDDRVAVVVECTGTNRGGILGMAPTGRTVRFRVVLLFDVREGRIVRDRRVYDFTGLLVQLGVLKAKPA